MYDLVCKKVPRVRAPCGLKSCVSLCFNNGGNLSLDGGVLGRR